MSVTVYYSEDGMFGSEGPEGYDVEACYTNFEAQVSAAIKAGYPELDVNVEYGPDAVKFTEYDEEELRPSIDNIIGRVYSDFDWVVEA